VKVDLSLRTRKPFNRRSRASLTAFFKHTPDAPGRGLSRSETGGLSMASVWFTATVREAEAVWTWSDTTRVMSEPLAGAWLPPRHRVEQRLGLCGKLSFRKYFGRFAVRRGSW
jgi:hypothetical protein